MTDVSKPSWLGQALAWAARLSRIGVWVGGSLTLASVLLISYDVIVRRLFGVTMGGSDELSSYAFAISTSWALAYTALERANVRVDVVYQHLPVRVAAVLDWVALVSLGVFGTIRVHDISRRESRDLFAPKSRLEAEADHYLMMRVVGSRRQQGLDLVLG